MVSTLHQEDLQKIFLNIPTMPYLLQTLCCLPLWQALPSATSDLPT